MADILLTGATGYLGERILERLLRETDDRVVALVRARDDEERDERGRSLLARLPRGGEARVRFLRGDLERDDGLDAVDPRDLSHVVHTAAVTRFNVEPHLAKSANVDGSRRVFELARRAPKLERLLHVSTVYACGLVDGDVREERHAPRPSFANEYEASKWAAEDALFTHYTDLPWRIARVATVIADDDSGRVSQQNAFHNSLKLFFYGLLSLLPGREGATLPFVTGGFSADAVTHLVLRPFDEQHPPHEVFHVAHTREESLTLGELVDRAYEIFLEERTFRAHNVLKPLFADERSFSLLASEAMAFGGSVVSQGMESVRPFAAQLFLDKRVHNERLRALLGGAYRAPDPRALCDDTCRWLVDTRFGRKSDG